MKIIKRDGTKQEFEGIKIKNAITKAFNEVYPDNFIEDEFLDKIVFTVINELDKRRHYTVEEIQDIVENILMEQDHKVAKHYITYRYKHQLERDKYNLLINAIANKIDAIDVKNQNANMDEKSFGGRAGEASNLLLKQYALDYCMSEKSKQNHLNNEIYIHDLDHFALGDHNCLSIPFDDLLEKGFNTRQTDVRPANSIGSAMQLIAVIFQLQSLQQFGGVSATHLDWTMVPYIRKSFAKHYKEGLKYISNKTEIDYEISFILNNAKDYSIEDSEYKAYNEKVYNYAIDMTRKECHQAIEGMYHNLNTLQSRSGNQLPFTSINYGTCTLAEGRMLIEELLNVSLEGLGNIHRTSVFPCGIFQLKENVNRKPGDPNYDLFQLALKSTSLRLYPNYANADWSNNKNWVAEDRKHKQEIIDSLSEEDKEKLILRVKENPILAKKLNLKLVDDD